MAIIVKKRGSFVVGYKIKEKNKIVSKAEPYWNLEQATMRCEELKDIEYSMDINLNMKIKDFILLYYDLIGKNMWNLRSYQSAMYQYEHYIVKAVNNDKLKIVNVEYAKELLEKIKELKVGSGVHEGEYISISTIEKIYSYIKSTFDFAYQINLYTFNPFDIGMKFEKKKSDIDRWSKENIIEVFEACKKSKLFIFLHLVFGCHMLAKEVLGVTWDETYIDDENYAKDTCYFRISKELQRVDISLAKVTNTQEVIKFFDPVKGENGNTRLALLSRQNGEMIIRIPKQVASILRDWKSVQQEYSKYKNSPYANEKFVICLVDGKPCEYRVIEKEFNALRKELGYSTLKLGQLKTFSQTRFYNGDTQTENIVKDEVYLELHNRGYLDTRTIAFKEIKFRSVVNHQQKVDLRQVTPKKKDEFDLFSLVQEIKKNPTLSKEFSRLLSE